MRSFIFILTLTVLVAGCTKTNEEQLLLEAKEQELCTRDTISFQQHIAPIISQGCMPCHNATTSEGGITLETYEQISGLASGGLLLSVVKHEPGYLPMPKNEPKLSECKIRALQVWFDQGFPNN